LGRRLSLSSTRARASIITIGALAPLVSVLGCEPSPWHGCPYDTFCVYENKAYGGNVKKWPEGSTDSDYRNNRWSTMTSDGMDNEVSSYVNRTDCTVVLFQDVGLQGQRSTIGAGEMQDDMRNDPNGDVGDNEASGHDSGC
jgi:hypothetical protein